MQDSEALSSPLARHRRKLIGFAAAITLYALMGFILLPWIAERQLVGITSDRLELSTSVESIYFNPFTFYLALDNLQIEDDGARLLDLSHLHTNLQASRFFLLKVQLSELVVSDVNLNLHRSTETENTLSRLANRWAQSSTAVATTEIETEDPESSALFPLEVINSNLSNIEINLRDSSLPTDFSSAVVIDQIQIDNLSTLEEAIGQHTIEVSLEQQGQMSLDGQFSINPLKLSGNVALQDFPLTMVSRYAQDSLPLGLDSGQFTVSINYDADLSADAPDVRLDDVTASIDSLVIVEDGQQTPLLELNQLLLTGGVIELPENTVVLPSLALNALSLSADINRQKEMNLSRLANAFGTLAAASDSSNEEATAQSSGTEPTPWRVELTQFDISDSSASFKDESLEQPFAINTRINGNISNLSNEANRLIPMNFEFGLNTGGTLAVLGEVGLLPAINLSATAEARDLDLTAVQPYINEFAYVAVEQGTLNVSSRVASNPAQPFEVSGSVAVSEFSAIDSQLEETLIAFGELAIDSATYSVSANAAEISEISLESLFARVIINEDGSSNIGRSIKPATSQDSQPTAEPAVDTTSADNEQTQPLAITVGQVKVSNGSANFTDKDLPIVFNANIANLSGLAEGFSNNTDQATNVNLEGEVDDYGLVQISSALKPFALTEQTVLDVDFTNIQMPAMTPYVIKFAGREILEGNVDLSLNYDVREGSLEANNQLVLSDLKLGVRVEHPDAMDLPLDLAIALLKDSNGVIDLEVPIAGDVDDPEFDFGPAIRRALRNVLTNIVAAPFRLLGSLVGSSDNELDHIRFLPGRSDIAAPERQVLVQLSEALKLRPQLALEISPVTSLDDPLALKTSAVNLKIEEALTLAGDSTESLVSRRRDILERFYTDSSATPTLAEIASNHEQPTQEGQAPALDVIAYNAALLQRLIEQETVSTDALEALAQARATAASNFLIEEAGVSVSQIQITDLSESELDDNGWLTMAFELTSTN
ncbi:MAG: DUF748 domain-containing protein [Pseudohongiellaceae bacterium]